MTYEQRNCILPDHVTACSIGINLTQQIMTQEKCERAVEALQNHGFKASHVTGAPDDHGVWLDAVWTDKLGDACSFRIHDEEIEWWQTQDKPA